MGTEKKIGMKYIRNDLSGVSSYVAVIAAIAVIAACATGAAILLTKDSGSIAETYSISYELNGGINSDQNPSKYTKGDTVELKDPSKTDHSFAGWYTDTGLTKKIDRITPDMSGDVKLYAKWTPLEGFRITYVLNGGTADPNSPERYVSGTITDLGCPTKDGYDFYGWYTDPEMTQNILYIDSGREGDLTLYASWDDTLVGHGFSFDTERLVTQRMMGRVNTYTVTGTYSYTYLHYDEEKEYLIHKVTYSVDQYHRVNSSDVTEWTSEDDTEYNVTIESNVQIELNGWKVTTDKVTLDAVYIDCTEIQYLIYGWLPVKLEAYVGQKSDSANKIQETYLLNEVLKVTVANSYKLTVFAESGIDVTGAGTIPMGDSATVTAIDSGSTFKGWYDDNGNLLSTNTSYTIDTMLADIVLYAYDTDVSDLAPEVNTEFHVDSAPGETDHQWYLMDMQYNVLDTGTDPTYTHTFTEVGTYILTYSAEDALGMDVNRFYVIVSDGISAKSYHWSCEGTDYVLELNIRYSDFYTYRASDIGRSQGTTSHDLEFITYADPYVVSIAEYINNATLGMTDLQKVDVLLRFTQKAIEYQYDSEGMGMEEYWKFPLETLYDMKGDCEDTSILFCAVGKAMGYDTALMLFSGHATGAVNLEDVGFSKSNVEIKKVMIWPFQYRYYPVLTDGAGDELTYAYAGDGENPDYYLYSETTSNEFTVGDVPYYGIYSVGNNPYSSLNVQKVIQVV